MLNTRARNRPVITPKGVSHKWKFITDRIAWNEIAEILGVRLDMSAHLESFFILKGNNGNIISIGELDDGFALARNILITRYGIHQDWYKDLQKVRPGVRVALFERAA